MKRPTFLTIWLSLMSLSAILSLYSYTVGMTNITKAFPNLPQWTLILLMVLSVAHMAAVVMLWKWIKMGFYIVLGAGVVGCLVNIMIFGPGTGLVSSIFALIGVGILHLAMKPVWNNFK